MLTRALVLLGCFVVAAVVITRAAHSELTPIRSPFSRFPMTLGEWRGVAEPPFDPRVLQVLGADDYLNRSYFQSARAGVGLYVGYYRSQREGDTIHSPLNCLPGAGWEPMARTTLRISVPSRSNGSAPSQILVNRLMVQKGAERQLVVYWYQSHGRVVASEYVSKFYLVADAVRLNRTDGAMVRVVSAVFPNVEDGEARAEATAVEFVKVLFPPLGDYLPS